MVGAAIMLPDGRGRSWSDDHTARPWDAATDTQLAVLERDERAVTGARAPYAPLSNPPRSCVYPATRTEPRTAPRTTWSIP